MGKRGNGEGSIYRTKDGVWVAAISVPQRDGTSKRVVRKRRTRRLAQVALQELQAAAAAGTPLAGRPETLAEYLSRWLEYKAARVRPATLLSYRLHCDVYLIPRLGSIRLPALTVAEVQACLDHWSASGRSPRTVSHIRDTLRAALGTAVRWELLGRNVARSAEPPRQRAPERVVFTPAQARVFLAASTGHPYEGIFVLTLLLGLRQGEVLGLPWDAVDLEGRTVRIRQALQRVNGHLSLVEPKTQASQRTLTLSARAVLALLRQREAQRLERAAAGLYWHEQGLVFTSRLGTPEHPGKVWAAFKRLCREHDLPALRFHDLRHTTASLLIAAKTDIKTVQEIMGHTDVHTTLQIYGHALAAQKSGALDALSTTLEPGSDPPATPPAAAAPAEG